MAPIGCLETSVGNYHYSLCNNPEEGSSQLLDGESLRSRIFQTFSRRGQDKVVGKHVLEACSGVEFHLHSFLLLPVGAGG